jgi:hypothetical protein
MKFNAIKGIVGGLAPTLGATLGGPLGATAGRVLAEVLGCDPSAKAIDDRLRQATPEDLVAIKEAELKYAAKMEELGVDMFELETADKQDARKYFAGDWTARVIGILAVVGFLAYIFTVTLMPPDANSDTIVSLVLGYLGGTVSAVISFYFGASQSQSTGAEGK